MFILNSMGEILKILCVLTFIVTTNALESSYYLQPLNVFYVEPPSASEVSEKPLEDSSSNMTCGELEVDQSCLVIKSNAESNIHFLYQSLECEKCPLMPLESVKPNKFKKVIVKFASLGSSWKVLNYDHNTTICNGQKFLGENSEYQLNVNETGCSLETVKGPDEIFIPILVAIAIYVLLAVFWMAGKYLKRKEILNHLFHRNSLDVSTDLAAAYSSSSMSDEKKQVAPRRLRSLDTVRGISIVIMIFVNYGGGGYEFFDHSIWNGLSVADLVFPWFIWMMGMSMALSLRSQLRQVISKRKIFWKILKRSVILFSLGVMLNTYCSVNGIDLNNLRILGVLQRFSISYFVVATVHLFYASADGLQTASLLQDLSSYGGEWLIMCSILIGHILITFLVFAPGCPQGYLGPGGLHDEAKSFNCTGGAAGFIDRLVLGESHVYQHPSSKAIYKSTLAHDPEGILGFFTSIFLVFLGLQAGKILLCYKDWKNRVVRWMIWGLITGVLAAILCKCSKNDGFIPVNKNLWSVSFIFATASLAFVLLSLCYLIIDVKNWWTGAPFYYAGMNSILLYVGHSLTHTMFPWRWQVESNHTNELFLSLWGTSLWVLIAIWMYKIKVFVTV